jgi:MFS family permease
MVIFSSTVGGAIGPVAAGYLFDITRNYNIIFWVLAILCAIGLVLTATLKPLSP